MKKTFATAINCIDGRAQAPAAEYLKSSFGVDFVDMITEPGPNKVISEGVSLETIESIKERVRLSVERNNSRNIAIVGHYDCKGNPASDEEQKRQLAEAVKVIDSWGFPLDAVIAVWLDENFEPSLV